MQFKYCKLASVALLVSIVLETEVRNRLDVQRTPESLSAALILCEQQITGNRSRLLEASGVVRVVSLLFRSMVRLEITGRDAVDSL